MGATVTIRDTWVVSGVKPDMPVPVRGNREAGTQFFYSLREGNYLSDGIYREM